MINECYSEHKEVFYGVPQGSTLGPVLFCVYSFPLKTVLKQYNCNYHVYADDTSVYVRINGDILKSLEQLSTILSGVKKVVQLDVSQTEYRKN